MATRSMTAAELSDQNIANMMKKSVTAKNPALLTKSFGNGGIVGIDERKVLLRESRKDKKNTLQEWHGMKRVTMTPELKSELELLKYRGFLNKDSAHLAPKMSNAPLPEFFETGFFAGTGKKKKKQLKSFADEWMGDNEQLDEKVGKLVTRGVRQRRAAKKKETNKAASKRQKQDSKKDKNKNKKAGKKMPPRE
jgi:hypothetical protein